MTISLFMVSLPAPRGGDVLTAYYTSLSPVGQEKPGAAPRPPEEEKLAYSLAVSTRAVRWQMITQASARVMLFSPLNLCSASPVRMPERYQR